VALSIFPGFTCGSFKKSLILQEEDDERYFSAGKIACLRNPVKPRSIWRNVWGRVLIPRSPRFTAASALWVSRAPGAGRICRTNIAGDNRRWE
jgi:hypothetical protein